MNYVQYLFKISKMYANKALNKSRCAAEKLSRKMALGLPRDKVNLNKLFLSKKNF